MPNFPSRRLPWLLYGLMLLGPGPAIAAPPPADLSIDRIQIVVNDEVITARQVDERIAIIRKRLASNRTALPPDDILRQQVMERLVMESLQLQTARLRKISVSDEQLDSAMRKIAERDRKTPDQIRREAEQEPGGYRFFREELKTHLLIQQLVEREVRARVFVSDSEVQTYLAAQSAGGHSEEYDLSHILIAIPEKASTEAIAAARKKAETVYAELQRGMDFRQAAVAHSQGQNALEGGGLGWRPAGQLPDLFLNAVRNLQPGELSELLRSPNGFHILRVNGRRGGGAAVNVTQTHARHILIKTGELVSLKEARRRADQLRELLLSGQDFAETAKSRSDDVGSAAGGGDLGWVNPGQTVPEFEKAMDALKPGEISQPVQSAFGVHLIQVLERRERDLSQEREIAQARQQIHARKSEERYEQWLRQLRDEAYVEFRTGSTN